MKPARHTATLLASAVVVHLRVSPHTLGDVVFDSEYFEHRAKRFWGVSRCCVGPLLKIHARRLLQSVGLSSSYSDTNRLFMLDCGHCSPSPTRPLPSSPILFDPIAVVNSCNSVSVCLRSSAIRAGAEGRRRPVRIRSGECRRVHTARATTTRTKLSFVLSRLCCCCSLLLLLLR